MSAIKPCPILLWTMKHSMQIAKAASSQYLSHLVPNQMLLNRRYLSSCPYSSIKRTASNGLAKLNQLFLGTYAVRKNAEKLTLGTEIPVILVNGDALILRHGGKRTEVNYVPPHYHHIKSLAHIACSIHTMNWMRKGGGEDVTKVESEIIASIEQILSSVDEKEEINKYRPLLEGYRKILKEKASESLIPHLKLLKSTLLELIDEAAKLRINALDEHVKEMKKQLSLEEKQRVAIVIMGPPMPREGELSMQYFKKIMAEDESLLGKCPHLNGSMTNLSQMFQGKWLIYAESIYEEDKALDLLTTYICDGTLGEDILGDKMRADFLAKAAEKHLASSNIEKFK